jgi:hypothetical protein
MSIVDENDMLIVFINDFRIIVKKFFLATFNTCTRIPAEYIPSPTL